MIKKEKTYPFPIKSLPCSHTKDFRLSLEVMNKIHSKGIFCVYSGGLPRDSILGKIPRDYDIVVSCSKKRLASIFKKVITVGEEFGMIKILYKGRTFDTLTLSGKTLFEDAKRREMTINSLYYNPFKEEIIDFTDGLKDIKNGLIRCFDENIKILSSDPVRVLRIIRSSEELGFKIESGLISTIKENIGLVQKIKPEKIRDELIRSLEYHNGRVFERFYEYRVFDMVLNGISDSNIKKIIVLNDNSEYFVRLAVLLSDLEEEDIKLFLSRFRFSGRIRERVLFIIRSFEYLKNMKKNIEYEDLKIFSHPYFHFLEDFVRIKGDTYLLKIIDNKKNIIGSINKSIVELTGKDILSAGISPGPIYDEIISKIRSLSIKGKIKNKSEAMDYIRKNYK